MMHGTMSLKFVDFKLHIFMSLRH